jgi:hypothetical protein
MCSLFSIYPRSVHFLGFLVYVSISILIIECVLSRLPVSTGAAGTLGTAYRAPYVTLNDGYRAHSLGQLSAVGVSRSVILQASMYPSTSTARIKFYCKIHTRGLLSCLKSLELHC